MIKAIDWRLRPPFESFLGGPMYPNGSDATVEDMIQRMDEANIAFGVAPFRKGMDNADGEKLVEQYGERFTYLAHIDPWDDFESIKNEIQKYVVNGHAPGIIMEPSMKFIQVPMRADDEERMYPIYDYCEKNDILVTITFGGLWTSSVGYYDPVIADNVAKDFPKMRIVLAHGGWPYSAGIIHVAYNRGNVYLSPELYMLPGVAGLLPAHAGWRDYVDAANGWLSKRILFGTGLAYIPGIHHKDIVQGFVRVLHDDVIEDVLYNNAASLLGFEEKRPILNVLGDPEGPR